MRKNAVLLMVVVLGFLFCTNYCYAAKTEDGTTDAESVVSYGYDGSAIQRLSTGTDGVLKTQYANSAVAVGEVAGSATAAVLPTVSARLVQIKAVKSNAGNVYIGIASVSKVDGTTDTTTGLELGPGETTGWIPASNLNLFYRICDNAGDDITYMVIQ